MALNRKHIENKHYQTMKLSSINYQTNKQTKIKYKSSKLAKTNTITNIWFSWFTRNNLISIPKSIQGRGTKIFIIKIPHIFEACILVVTVWNVVVVLFVINCSNMVFYCVLIFRNCKPYFVFANHALQHSIFYHVLICPYCKSYVVVCLL